MSTSTHPEQHHDSSTTVDLVEEQLELQNNTVVQGNEEEHTAPQQSSSNVGSAMDLFSSLVPVVNAGKTCPVHERCDGSCTGTQSQFQALTSGLANFKIEISPAPAIVPPGATPRDLEWSQQQSLPEFSYDALDSANAYIRLLKIKPAVFRADIVECELIVASLDSGIKYNALSYTWGEPVFDQPIHIDGKKAWITTGLSNALKAYRQAKAGIHDVPIWADAVSIHQKDACEITAQLPLMKRIYSKAKIVFVDLGDVDESWFQGYNLMQNLCMAFELEKKRFEREQTGPPPSVNQIIEMYRLPLREHPAWKSYAQAFASPWFRRTWILQEIALATRAEARIGQFLIDWKFFDESFYLFTALGMHVFLQNAPSDIQGGILAMFKIQDLCSISKREATWSESIRLLRLTNNFRTSDARDKVIGILGLLRSPRTIARLPFLADYSLTVDETYHRFALHLAEMDITQLMLNHSGLQRRSYVTINAPSWVPDWTAQSRNFGPLPLVLFRPKLYQAATTRNFSSMIFGFDRNNPHVLDTAKMRVLAIKGGTLDELACLSRARPCYDESGKESTSEILTEFWEWMSSVKTGFEDSYLKMDLREPFRLEAFARTLLVDDDYIGENATSKSSPITNFEECYVKTCSLLKHGIENPVQSQIFTSGVMNPEQTFILQAMVATVGKRMAISKKGRFCLVPSSSEVGDQVVILLGANVPYIVRPACENKKVVVPEQQFRGRLIGDAYVDGMMDGEALNLKDFVEIEIHLW